MARAVPSSIPAPPGARGARALSPRESRTSDERLGQRRAAALGALVLPSFALLDVFMVRALHPEVALLGVMALRVVASLAAVVAWLVARSPRWSDRASTSAHALCIVVLTFVIARMSADFGGPSSPYVHGLTIVLLVRATFVPSRFRDTVWIGLGMVTLALASTAVIAHAEPERFHAWSEPRMLATFASHYVLVAASMLVCAAASHATWAAREQLHQARKLGRYRLEAPIGQGGMNEVWLAWDTALKRDVALKILRAPHASPEAVALFEREALASSQLEDPHTVRIYDYGASDDGIYFIAMEYLVGADLGQLVKAHGAMPPGRVVWLGLQACDSLEAAHARGLVHRDIKPQNFFVTRVGDQFDFLKLLDFGIARSIHEADGLTRAGVLRGTPAYMAPECCRGEPAREASDVYSLGATLYFLLVGAPPFDGDDVRVLTMHLEEAPVPPSQRLARPLANDLEEVVLRCLSKRPEDRYGSVRELRAALAACRDASAWCADDAARFWNETRVSALERWDAPTLA